MANKINKSYNDQMAKYNTPVFTKCGEALVYLPDVRGRIMQFFGFFIPLKISRGENFDIVDAQFGLTKKTRALLVTNNHARRQLLTLKKGQFAIAYGEARLIVSKNQYGYSKQWHFNAYMIQGLYVPKAFDVKKHNQDVAEGVEIEQIDNITEKQQSYYQSVIDDMLNQEHEYDLDMFKIKDGDDNG